MQDYGQGTKQLSKLLIALLETHRSGNKDGKRINLKCTEEGILDRELL